MSVGRPPKPQPRTGYKGINENRTEYFLRTGYQALRDIPDSKRAKDFRLYANRIARQVNKQLAQLKSKGMIHYAYETVQAFTKRNYGTTRLKLSQSGISPQQLYRQTLLAQRFLNFSTATPEGYKEQIDIRVKKMQQILEKGGFKDESEENIRSFLWILSDESIKETLRELHSTDRQTSDQLVEMIYGAYHESTIDEIKEAFQNYREALNKIGTKEATDYNLDKLRDTLLDLQLSKH